MKIYKGLDDIDNSPKVVTLGNFDGVHKGHRELINKAISKGKDLNFLSYVLSFYPHPRSFFHEDIKYINTLPQKNENMRSLGIDALIVLEFTEEIANLSKEAFIEEILYKKLNAKVIIVGFDFLFGKKREGNVENLKEIAERHGIEVLVIPVVEVDGKRVSSSLIRECYKKGHVKEAKKYLGYYPTISGKVIKGKQIGRTIGFPTANIEYDKEQMIPSNGVYAVNVIVKGKEYLGVGNIGVKPTVKSDPMIEIEIHILNYSEDIYGEEVQVSFLENIRQEKKFINVEELKKQIVNDVSEVVKRYCFT